jgi:colicin import membrane protein
MNSQSVTQILLNLKTLVGDETFQQSLYAISAKPEKSSAFGVPKQWNKTVQQTVDRLNALPEALPADALPQAATASASKKKGGRPTKAEAEAKLAAMTPEERVQAEAKKAEAKAKRDAKKAEVSDSASVASATEAASANASAASGNVSETGSKKKAGRPKMTEEQKAEAKAKREAKKAAKAAEPAEPAEPSALEGEWADMAEALESE